MTGDEEEEAQALALRLAAELIALGQRRRPPADEDGEVPVLSAEEIRRIRAVDLAWRGGEVTMGAERMRLVALRLVARWLHRIRDAKVRGADFERELKGLLLDLAAETDDDAFTRFAVRVDVRDEVALGKRQATGALAWLCLRAGALGERRIEMPDEEDVGELVRTIRKARAKEKRKHP